MAATGGQSPAQGKEVVFDLDAAAFSSDHFRMHEFKVKRCPRARPHDWTQCPFAHPGEKARRRDPRRYRYSGTACPEFRKSGCCRRGDACPFAHGVFECWLHPSRYRTQLCTDGASCKRRVCFFAHSDSELRRPEDDPVVAQSQVQADLAAEVQSLQQQHLTQALSALLAANGQSAQGAAGGLAGSQLNLLTLELMKQVTPSMGSPPSGSVDYSNAGLQLALLQQLALVEQVQKQQQQQQQQQQQHCEHAQQMVDGYGGQCAGGQDTNMKGLQALLAAVSQNSIQQALKSQLAEQVPTSSSVQGALSTMTGTAAPTAPCPAQMPASVPIPATTGAVGGYVGGAQVQEDAGVVSAAMVTNGFVGGYDMQGTITAGHPMDLNGAMQVNGFLQANGFLSSGQLSALRSRAAALTGGRRSIDNGVLARSMNELVGALDATDLGTGQQMATLGGGVPLMYSAPLTNDSTSSAMDTFAALPDEEALKQAKSLLENLHILQGAKNNPSGPGLMEGINMETLLAANGLPAISRATSVDK